MNSPELRRRAKQTARRNVSIGSDSSNEERANEIKELQQAGVLPEDFLSKEKFDEDDLCQELDALLLEGVLTQADVTRIKHGSLDMKPHSSSTYETNEHTQACNFNQEYEQVLPPFASDGLPVNWSRETNNLLTVVQLKSGDPEFDIIESEFKGANIKVKKIERIQNKRLLDRFKSEMDDIEQHRSTDFCINARYLYHGTTVDKDCLCEEGLDQRLSRMGYFGKGIYFSDNPVKCVHYSNDPCKQDTEEKYILKCRVILGDTKVYLDGCYDTTLKREPLKESPTYGWKYYDSVKGCPKDHNEFVVYDNRRAMIEYIITFNMDSKMADHFRTQSKQASQLRSRKDSQRDGVVPTDEHFQRLSEVREAVRKKRLEDSGKVYTAPSQSQVHTDRQTWTRLQKLHGVEPNLHSVQTASTDFEPTSFTSPNMEEEAELTQEKSDWPRDDMLPSDWSTDGILSEWSEQGSGLDMQSDDIFARWSENTENSQHSEEQAGLLTAEFQPATGVPDNPIDQVLSVCIAEFMTITDMEDVKLAKYFIQKANMDVNHAISLYYEEMPGVH